MSAHIILFSEFDALRFECDDDAPIVRIDGGRDSVSLHLNLAGIEALETALAAARMNLAAQDARKAA